MNFKAPSEKFYFSGYKRPDVHAIKLNVFSSGTTDVAFKIKRSEKMNVVN